MPYKGRISGTGNSKSFVFESALFHLHPEFNGNVEAECIGRGVLLVRAVGSEDKWGPDDEPVLGAVLPFIERDMIDHPEGIQPLPMDILARSERLVRACT